MMLVRESKRGPFLGCSKFPRCRKHHDPEGAGRSVPAAGEQPATLPDGAAAGVAGPPTADGQLDLACDKCGAPMVVRLSARGPFVACSAYPKCKNSKPMQVAYEAGYEKPQPKTLDETCPECGKPLLVRSSRRGEFVGCSAIPSAGMRGT